LRLLQHLLIPGCALAAGVAGAEAQEHIGSTALAHNEVTRDLSGASAPLVAGDSVFRNEVVRTGPDSTAKLIFLDSTNLGVGPVSSVKLDQFVYVGESNGQKQSREGRLSPPSASAALCSTLAYRTGSPKWTLVEGQALICPRRSCITVGV
jgi:hypothetical protein